MNNNEADILEISRFTIEYFNSLQSILLIHYNNTNRAFIKNQIYFHYQDMRC